MCALLRSNLSVFEISLSAELSEVTDWAYEVAAWIRVRMMERFEVEGLKAPKKDAFREVATASHFSPN